MNDKQLKVLIKEMVRQSLLEIFAEMKLESIVEGVIKKQSTPSRTIKEGVQARETNKEDNSAAMIALKRKREMLDKLQVNKSPISGILKETLEESADEILKESRAPRHTAPQQDDPSPLSESDLEELGLFGKDFSQHIK
jgi:hypothetical protein